MNLIRLIKLKKINGELNYLTKPEKHVLSFFDGLKSDNYNLYYKKDGDLIIPYFEIDIKSKTFYCSYSNVCNVIRVKYRISSYSLSILIPKIIEKVGLSGYVVIYVTDIDN